MPRGSMSANYYFPPDWDPSKGGLNKFHGVHALRERAKKIDQGILVIRFEMPFNVWCEHCNAHIGKGVRYNAEKKTVGNYFTTKIWEFTMPCHLCSGQLVMQTDPKNSDYVCIRGVKRKTEVWDEGDNETLTLASTEEKDKRESDPFYKLEHAGLVDNSIKKEQLPQVAALKKFKEDRSNDGDLNRLLRHRFREDKKEHLAQEAADAAHRQKLNLEMRLVPVSEADVSAAAMVTFEGSRRHSSFSENKVEKRAQIRTQSLFAGGGGGGAGAKSTTATTSATTAATTRSDASLLSGSKRKAGTEVGIVGSDDVAAMAVRRAEEARQHRLNSLKKAHERGINPALLHAKSTATSTKLSSSSIFSKTKAAAQSATTAVTSAARPTTPSSVRVVPKNASSSALASALAGY